MPLAGHDAKALVVAQSKIAISTPMPLAGHDFGTDTLIPFIDRFLLPCPSRGMTDTLLQLIENIKFLLPCPSRGMTSHPCHLPSCEDISTPMPLAGHDLPALISGLFLIFLLPCPSRGMTCFFRNTCEIRKFLLPCPSRGMTRMCITHKIKSAFLLPCPSRGMTNVHRNGRLENRISTPMPLAGHDWLREISLVCVLQFLLPCPSRGMTLEWAA